MQYNVVYVTQTKSHTPQLQVKLIYFSVVLKKIIDLYSLKYGHQQQEKHCHTKI